MLLLGRDSLLMAGGASSRARLLIALPMLVAALGLSSLLLFATAAKSNADVVWEAALANANELDAKQLATSLGGLLVSPDYAGCSGVLVDRGVDGVNGANGAFVIVRVLPYGYKERSLPLSRGHLHAVLSQGLPLGQFLQCEGNKNAFGTKWRMDPANWQPQRLVANPIVGARPDACALRGRTDVLVVGSSVARGTEHDEAGLESDCGGDLVPYLSHKCGWAGRLGEALSSQLGLCMQTEAVAGSTARAVAWLMPAALRRHRPKVVVIGLSPANDGLHWTSRREDAEALGDRYLASLKSIANYAEHFPGVEKVIIGGPYPNGHANSGAGYNSYQADVVHRVRDTMVHGWVANHPRFAVIDFLTTTEDGNRTARWSAGLVDPNRNGGHPNTHGYARMFSAVNLADFASVAHAAHMQMAYYANAHQLAEVKRLEQPWLAELKKEYAQGQGQGTPSRSLMREGEGARAEAEETRASGADIP